MNKISSVLVKGSLSYNLGDDLLIITLANRYPNVRFEIIAPKDYTAFSAIPNVKVVGLPISQFEKRFCSLIGKLSSRLYAILLTFFSTFFFRNHIARVDAFVIIGGSMFKQAKHSSVTFYYNSKIMDIVASKPSFVLGANFGPYTTDVFLDNYREYFSRFTDVCFRDLYSYELFPNLNNIRYHKDILFQYQMPVNDKVNGKVGFVVVDFEQHLGLKKYKRQYEMFITKAASYYVNNEKNFTLIAFQKNELTYLNSLKSKIESEIKHEIHLLVYNGDQQSFLHCYQSFDTVFATRFHSMILSFMTGQKNCPIIYNKKLQNFIDDINYKGLYVDLNNLNATDDFFVELQNSEVAKYDFSDDAEKHFEILDRMII